MEKIKDWKSYQHILNRRKRRKPKLFSVAKFAFFLIAFVLVSVGILKGFYFVKSYHYKNNKLSIGTGIRPIKLTADPQDNHPQTAKNLSNERLLAGKYFIKTGSFSIAMLKKFFETNQPQFNLIKDGHYIQKIGKYTIIYTLSPVVQQEAQKIFKEYNVPFGALAAVNPETGAILSLATYARNSSKKAEISDLLPYRSGSLVKIITASAAIESKGFYPGVTICYNGGLYGTNKNYWMQNPSTGANKISFKLAFAKSCDIAFGKIAGFYVGGSLLKKYFNGFHFNHEIPFILDLKKSTAKVPDRLYSLELTGAGFKNIRITPILASLIAASTINGGKLLKPYIIKEVIGPNGKIYYKHKGVKVLSSPITAATANVLKTMMMGTVIKGVAHPDFYNVYNQYLLPGVVTGGKTGTISGVKPTGLYQWFAGFGEKGNKKIALSVLVVEKPVWKIESGGVSEKVLSSYFFKNYTIGHKLELAQQMKN
jgi:cell division protein FtsI/penicillin-binding protein 2